MGAAGSVIGVPFAYRQTQEPELAVQVPDPVQVPRPVPDPPSDSEPECPVCLVPHGDNPFVTPCKHAFCRPCIQKLYASHTIACPLCRGPCDLPGTEATFDFITDRSEREMLWYAYRTIHALNKWAYLSANGIDLRFAYANNAEHLELMNQVARDYGNHTRYTMGYTMLRMQFIAKYGYSEFARLRDYE